jgi:hypothetical protein
MPRPCAHGLARHEEHRTALELSDRVAEPDDLPAVVDSQCYLDHPAIIAGPETIEVLQGATLGHDEGVRLHADLHLANDVASIVDGVGVEEAGSGNSTHTQIDGCG